MSITGKRIEVNRPQLNVLVKGDGPDVLLIQGSDGGKAFTYIP